MFNVVFDCNIGNSLLSRSQKSANVHYETVHRYWNLLEYFTHYVSYYIICINTDRHKIIGLSQRYEKQNGMHRLILFMRTHMKQMKCVITTKNIATCVTLTFVSSKSNVMVGTK